MTSSGSSRCSWFAGAEASRSAPSSRRLAAALGGSLTVDDAAIVASLLYYWVPDSRCAFREAEKLQPGTWIRFRPDGQVDRGSYWSIREVAEAAAEQPPLTAAELDAVVADSTRRHLLSDVPVATFLSGGLDSSYLTALAARAQPGDLGLHHRVPRRRCEVRGDAGRPALRPPGCRSASAWTCTRSRSRRTCWTCCRE